MNYDKALSLDNTEYLMVRSSRVGGPVTKGSRGGGQAFGKYYMYISNDNGKSWKLTNFSSFQDTETYIKSNTDIVIGSL